MNPNDSAAQLGAALAHHRRGDPAAAERLYREVLAVSPKSFDALHLLGVALTQRGAYEEGIARMRQAITLDGTQSNVRFSLARALLEKGDSAGALVACNALVAVQPRSAEAWCLCGNARQASGSHVAALDDYGMALRLKPDFPAALNNLGHSLRMVHFADRAIGAFDRALALQPAYVMALNNRGLALLDLQRPADALQDFDRALVEQPRCAEFLSNRGAALLALKRFAEAAANFQRLLAVAPTFTAGLGNLIYARRSCCDWSDDAELGLALVSALDRGEFAALPLVFIAASDAPAAQLACARIFCSQRYPESSANDSLPRRGDETRRERIRIAYVSGDFGEHAVSYLLCGVFEHHDRSRFDSIAIAWGRRHDGPMRTRLEAAFDEFVDVTEMSDAKIVAHLRELEVDIAIDLSGHTGAQRTGIFTGRAAPVQVSYLGFPATMGTRSIDYIVADAFVIPAENQHDYSESVVYLPDSFQANDDRRMADSVALARADVGLPERAFVWCSFHASYKLNPTLFDVWVRLVQAVPNSVLWLLGGNPEVEQNLRRESLCRGLEPERLVFAPHVSYPQHLARLRLADLCLDTLPFNGGATTSDALWAEVPVVTCAGHSFAARMSGSLLHALGLPELVTHSLQDYEQLALHLALDADRLNDIRERLAHNRRSTPLFDTARFCRHLEGAYIRMVERHRRGDGPATLRISRIDS